jgi:pimeloyl-ACP methyl ester carboxylesterase
MPVNPQVAHHGVRYSKKEATMLRHAITGNGGIRLNVVEAGNPAGQPILFIHGWSQSRLSWAKQFDSELAERFRLVVMDLRGHGDSDKPVTGYAESHVWGDDVKAVLDQLSLNGALLVGWSYGGLVINDYVRVHGQDRLAGLCYVGAATDLGVETAYKFLGATWNGLLPTRADSVAGTVFSEDAEEITSAMRMFLRGCFAQRLPPDEEMMLLGFNLLCPSRVRAALFSRSLQNDEVLAKLRLPVLVVHGDADEVVNIETGQHIASTVRDASMSVFAGAGHGPFWEQSERFNAELAEFVSSLGLST